MSNKRNYEGARAPNNCNPPMVAEAGEKTTRVREVCGSYKGQRDSNCLLPQRYITDGLSSKSFETPHNQTVLALGRVATPAALAIPPAEAPRGAPPACR